MRLETSDDHALAYIRPVNILRSGGSLAHQEKSHLTLVFSIKTQGKFVSPPQGLRIKRPFVNKGWNILKVLWWTPLGNISYHEARLQTARFLDLIHGLLVKNAPIVAIRATLIDWKKGKAVRPSVLRDPWWYTKTFDGLELTPHRLRGYGMDVNNGFYPKYDQNGTSVLENVLNFDLEDTLNTAITLIVTKISKILSKRSVMQTHDMQPLIARRVLVTTQSPAFLRRLRMYVENLYTSSTEFATAVIQPYGYNTLLSCAKKWVRQEIENIISPKNEQKITRG